MQFSNILRQYNNNRDDYIFSFINGKVIGTNLKILTKYIKSILGNDVKTMGICLIVVGFSLALSIPFTILFIIIINESYQAKNSANKQTYVSRVINDFHQKYKIQVNNYISTPTSSRIIKSNRTYNDFDEAKELLIKGCKIDKEILDDTYNRKNDWRTNDSGPKGYLKKYHPPNGLIGIGLKIAVKYLKEGNEHWIGDDNNEGEWYIAYHGVKSIDSIKKICKEGFRRGSGQAYKDNDNKNPLNNNIKKNVKKEFISLMKLKKLNIMLNPLIIITNNIK